MAVYLLDTSVIIDVLNNKRGRPALLLELARAGHTLACCPINITEVYAGLRPKEEAATEQLLSSLRHFPIQPEAARMAGEFKRDHGDATRPGNAGGWPYSAPAYSNRLRTPAPREPRSPGVRRKGTTRHCPPRQVSRRGNSRAFQHPPERQPVTFSVDRGVGGKSVDGHGGTP